jgi:hypothetical protein
MDQPEPVEPTGSIKPRPKKQNVTKETPIRVSVPSRTPAAQQTKTDTPASNASDQSQKRRSSRQVMPPREYWAQSTERRKSAVKLEWGTGRVILIDDEPEKLESESESEQEGVLTVKDDNPQDDPMETRPKKTPQRSKAKENETDNEDDSQDEMKPTKKRQSGGGLKKAIAKASAKNQQKPVVTSDEEGDEIEEDNLFDAHGKPNLASETELFLEKIPMRQGGKPAAKSTSRRASRPTTWWRWCARSPASRRSVTPARSTPSPRGCSRWRSATRRA